MNFKDVVQDYEIFKIDYESRPIKSKLSADTIGLFVYLMSQKAAKPNISFEYSNDPITFYKETCNALQPFVNAKLLGDKEPAQKISIRGPIINTLYAKPSLTYDGKSAGILCVTMPNMDTTWYKSQFNYAMGVVPRFIMALQVHCEVNGMFIGDIRTPMLKSYPNKELGKQEWIIYRDPDIFDKLYIFVPKEVLEVAKQHCPSAVSNVTPSHLLEKCTRVKDSYAIDKKAADLPDNIWS